MKNLEWDKDVQLNEGKSHNKSVTINDKTAVINDEAEVDEYNLGDRDDDYIYFCNQWRCLWKVRPGRIKLLDEDDGQYVSFQCKSWDCPENGTERNELWLHNKDRMYEFDERGKCRKKEGFDFNKTYRYKFSFRIPENFPLSPTRLVIWQWKFNKLINGKENEGPSPILAQRIRKINWKYYLVITNSHNKQIGKGILIDDIKGKWVDMEYNVNFSDKEDIESSVEIIANIEWKKVNVFKWKYGIRDEKNKFKLNPDKTHTWYFKFWLYRDGYELAKEKINTDYEKSIKKINEDKRLNENEKKAKIAQANIDKDNDLNEIEQANKTEKENPMEIHFKNFSIEELNTNTEDIKQSRVEQENEAKKLTQKYLNWDTEDVKHLTRLLKQWDTMKVYSEFFKIDEKFKLAIENLKEPQTQKVYASLQFLMPDHRDYIDETQKEYQNLFNKVKNFNQNNILKVIEEKDINKIVDLKNQSKKLKSRLKKLKKYEKWEFINLPNWLSYEFCKKNEEDSIPNWINLWENDYFIKPHVSENYDLFIGSLLEIKQLLKKNKWINIKYCKATSWLMNIEFLRWYFWDQKPNIIRIFEQMEPACISFKIDEKNNAATQKNPHKNPLRFIEQPSKLYDYIKDGHEEQFCEAEMWLDLDRLEIVNWLKEKNDYIIESYSIKDIINDGRIQPKDKIHTIINIIHNDIKNWDDHRKVTIDWKVLPFSCWNKALLLNQIFKEYWNELWITESYVAQPNWHAMNIIKFNWDFCIADSSDGTIFANIEQNYKIRHIGNIDVFELKKPLKNNQWEYNYTIFPIINLWSKTELYISAALEEYDLSVKEKMYQKTSTNDYDKLKSYVETLINSNELNPLNYFTWEEYLWVAKSKENNEYKKQIKELEYLMQDTRSLNEIQERRKILQAIKQKLGVDENLINKINNNQIFFNKILKSIAKFFKKSWY